MSFIKKIGFLMAFILPVLLIIGYYLGGYYNALVLIFAFVLIPLADLLVGKDPENLAEIRVSEVAEEKYYRFVTYVWVYVQWGVVGWGAYVFAVDSWNVLPRLMFLLSVATVTGGIGITVAHELGHRTSAIEQLYAKALLVTVSYLHFFIEHNQGHHVWIATPHDPATSRKGETLYAFWWRSVSGGVMSAWQIEAKRLARKGLQKISIKNKMIQFGIATVGFCALLVLFVSALAGEWLGGMVVLFFVTQSILAFSLLEAVNYIEHYGIVRKQISPTRYERVTPLHSWNANQLVTNFFLFQLQRHSDHHANASRRYQVLRHFDESPQMPFGYPTMIMMAMFPPLWFGVMDKRLEANLPEYSQ